MTQQDDITQRVLTDDEIRDIITGTHQAFGEFKSGYMLVLGRAIESAVLSKLRAPVADTYVEARECGACGHVGINDSSDTLAACKNCDWSGDSPKEDHCPGCAQVGTMTAACPKCGSQYSLLADRTISAALASAPVAGEAFMYGIMGPDGKAHLDEFCVSADPAELEQEVVAHMNEDHKGGKYSVVALFANAAPQASAENVHNAALEKAARLMEQTGKRIAASDIRSLKTQADRDGGTHG